MYSTEEILNLLPPKEEPDYEVDFMGILDNFDPTQLTDESIQMLASRNVFETTKNIGNKLDVFGNQIVPPPAPHRLKIAENGLIMRRASMEKRLLAYRNKKCSYGSMRAILVAAIGEKTACHIVRKEMENLTHRDKERQAREYAVYMDLLKRCMNEHVAKFKSQECRQKRQRKV